MENPRCFLCGDYTPNIPEEISVSDIIKRLVNIRLILGINIKYDEEWPLKYCCFECYLMNSIIKQEVTG